MSKKNYKFTFKNTKKSKYCFYDLEDWGAIASVIIAVLIIAVITIIRMF